MYPLERPFSHSESRLDHIYRVVQPNRRSLAYLVLFVLATAPSLWADRPQMCTVRGRVVSAADSRPIKNARVQLKSVDDLQRFYDVTTDDEGEFAFQQVLPGTYHLIARHNRFVPGVYGQKSDAFSSGGLLTLKPGAELNDLLFRLMQTAVIVGQIVGDDGEPLPGVEVEALLKPASFPAVTQAEANTSLVPIQTVVTNDLGQYRLYALPPGSYFVSAVDSGMPDLTDAALRRGFGYDLADAPQPKYPPTYYPGTTDPSQAERVPVRSGDEVRVDFRLRAVDTYKVTGRVLDANGRPVQRAGVSISPDDPAMAFSGLQYAGETDSGGNFQISGVASGNYTVNASSAQDEQQRIAVVPITVSGGDVTGLDLVLVSPVKLSGRIIFEGAASLQPGQRIVWLHPVVERGHQFGAGEITKDNTFVVGGLTPGVYTILVTSLAGDSYLASGHLGNTDVLTDGLQIDGSASAATLELTINPNGAGVEGWVTKAQQPVAGAAVHIEPTDPAKGRKLAQTDAQTDQYGHFAFHGLPPGGYVLSAEPDEQSGSEHTQKINLSAGQHRKITMKLDESQ